MFGCGSSAQQGARRRLNTIPSITISGIVAHGEELFANGARYDDLQWYADGVAISGQSGSMYTVDRADGVIGPEITCVATSEYGSTTSNTLAYYPAQLSGIRAVYDFSRGTTLSGSYITALADQSSAGNHLAAPTLANAPLLTTSDMEFGGQPTATFDGIDDYLYRTSFSMGGGVSSGTMIMPVRLLAQDNADTLLQYGTSYTNQATVGRLRSYWNGVAPIVSPQNFAVKPYIYEASYTGTETTAYVDGEQGTTSSLSTTGADNGAFGFGAGSSGLNPSYFKTPMFCILNRALTSDERADFQSYFDWRFPQQAVDLLTAGTFTRASEASYLLSAPTDGTTPFMAWAGTNVRRIEDGKLLMEGSRTNYSIYCRDPGSGWSSGGSYTHALSGSPDGTANVANGVVASAGFGRYITRTLTIGAKYVSSMWAKRPIASGSGPFQYTIQNPNSTNAHAVTGIIGETYERVELAFTQGASTQNIYVPMEGRTFSSSAYVPSGTVNTALNLEMDLHQTELGVFPSSPIQTIGNTPVTRAADVLTYTTGSYPASFLTDGFTFKFTPQYSSDEMVSGAASQRMFAVGAGSQNGLYIGPFGVAARLLAYESGGLKINTPVFTFSRGQEITITVNPNAGTITIAGATTGDGTTAGTAFSWTANTIAIGSDASGGSGVFGHFGGTISAITGAV